MTFGTSLDTTCMASATGVSFKQEQQSNSPIYRPEKIVCIGQAQTGKEVKFNTLVLSSFNSDDIGLIYGFGSPLHRMALKLFPKSGNGSKVDTYFIPVEAPSTGSAETKTITVEATAVSKSFSGFIKVKDSAFEAAADIAGKVATRYQNNPAQAPRGMELNSFETSFIPFSLTKGMDAAAVVKAIADTIAQNINLPFIVTLSDETPKVMTLTAKWVGEDSKFDIEILDENKQAIKASDYGVTFTIATTQEAAGAQVISDEALDLITEELGATRVVSQFTSVNNLNKLKDKFKGFQDALIAQYAICYTSCVAPKRSNPKDTYDIEQLLTFSVARADDNVNVQIYGDYGDLRPLRYKERNQLLRSGISNIVRKSTGGYVLYDLVTFYNTAAGTKDIGKYDRDITVLANIAYDLMKTFRDSEEWKSIIIVSDNDYVTNPAARSLKAIKAELNKRISLLGQAALIADYVNAQKNTKVAINKANPDRIDIEPHFFITGVGRVINIENFVSFYYGA